MVTGVVQLYGWAASPERPAFDLEERAEAPNTTLLIPYMQLYTDGLDRDPPVIPRCAQKKFSMISELMSAGITEIPSFKQLSTKDSKPITSHSISSLHSSDIRVGLAGGSSADEPSAFRFFARFFSSSFLSFSSASQFLNHARTSRFFFSRGSSVDLTGEVVLKNPTRTEVCSRRAMVLSSSPVNKLPINILMDIYKLYPSYLLIFN